MFQEKRLKQVFLASVAYISILLYHTHSFLRTGNFAGRDLVGAYSLVESFQFGWSTEWFLGFPMFKFYPPGFFFTADKIGFLTGDLLAFKLLTYLSLMVFPITVYYCFKTLFNQRTGLLSIALSFSVIFLREPFSLIYQSFQVGLVAQMFALPFLFLYIGLLWKNSRGSAYLLGILMALMIISHPYIAAVAVLYTAIYFVATRNIERVLASSTGFLLTAWWWIPILEKSWYMQNYVGPTGNLLNWPWLFFPFLAINRSRKALSVGILSVLLLVIGTFDFGLDIQFYRFYIYGQIMAVLAVAPGLNKAVNHLEDKIQPRKLVSLIVIVFIASSVMVDVSEDWRSDVELDGVVPEDGRMIVETSHSDLYNAYVPIQKIPLESNATVVNGLYADSSISSPYLLGLEKAFAEDPVPNPIAVEANLTSEQLEERFEYFEIEYALVRTEHAREKLKFMEEVDSNDDFTLLHMSVDSERTTTPVRVHGDYSRWRELNKHIFRNNLTPVFYTEKDGYSLQNYSNRELTELSRQSNQSQVEIYIESIDPDRREQILFGLRTN